MQETKVKAHWLTSTVLGIGMASLFSDMSHETVTVLLPVLLGSMGAAAGALGTIEAVADGISSVAKRYGGWWTDRLHRRKPICVAGYGLMAGATGIVAMATAWPAILAGRSVSWLARGFRAPAKKALLAEAVTSETYGRAFGFERTMDTLGAVIAPLATLALLGIGLTNRKVLWLAVIPAALAGLAVLVLVRETRGRTPSRRPLIASLRGLPPSFTRFLRAVGLFGAGDFAHSMLILYAVMSLTRAYGSVRAGIVAAGLYAVHNVVYAGISYPAGVAADRMNKRSLLAIGYGSGALTALLLAAGFQTLPWLTAAFVLAGAYVGIQDTVEDSLAAELLPESLRGTGFGAMAVVNGAGDFASSLIVGWLWSSVGPYAGFGYAFVLMAAGAAVVWFTRAQ